MPDKRHAKKARNVELVRQAIEGSRLRDIARAEGISAERVRQLVFRHVSRAADRRAFEETPSLREVRKRPAKWIAWIQEDAR